MPIVAGGPDFAERMWETCGDASSCALLITYLIPTACAPATTPILLFRQALRTALNIRCFIDRCYDRFFDGHLVW